MMLPTGSNSSGAGNAGAGAAASDRSRKRRPAGSSGGSRAHQQRSIPTHIVTGWTSSSKPRLVILAAGIFCLGSMSLLPILLLESLDAGNGSGNGGMSSSHVSVQSLLDIAQGLRRQKGATAATPGATTSTSGTVTAPVAKSGGTITRSTTEAEAEDSENSNSKLPNKPVSSLHELEPDMHYQKKPVARGVAGRPREETPSVLGAASRAHITCPELSVDSLAYWNDPVGVLDVGFQSPYKVDNRPTPEKPNNEHYMSFSPDRGGWNNVSQFHSLLSLLLRYYC
jgi:hypothetical protein